MRSANIISYALLIALSMQVLSAIFPLSSIVTYMWYATPWLLGGVFYWMALRKGGAVSGAIWVACVGAYSVYGFESQNYRNFIIVDATYMMIFLLAFVKLSAEEYLKILDAVVTSLSRFLLFAIPIVLIALYTLDFQPGDAETRYKMDLHAGVDTFLLTGSIQIAMYFMPFFTRVNGWKKYSIPVAVLLYAYYALLTGSRTANFAAFLSIALTVFFLRKNTHAAIRRQMRAIWLIIGLSALLLLVFMGRKGIQGTLEMQQSRLEIRDDYTSGRYDEVIGTYEEMSLSEVILGRGFGAAKENLSAIQTVYGVNMIHFGPMHLIYKGGIVLLVVVYGTIIWAFIVVARRRFFRWELLVLLTLFVINDLTHQQWQNPFPLLALSIGVCGARVILRARWEPVLTTGMKKVVRVKKEEKKVEV